MVVSTAAAPGLVIACGQLRHIGRYVKRCDVNLLVLCFRRSGQDIGDKRNDQQRHRRNMQADSKHLASSEVFILRPDVLHFDRSYSRWQGSLLWRREEVPESAAESTEIRAPGYGQPAIDGSFRGRAGFEKFREIAAEARSKGYLSERRILPFAHFNRTLDKKLPQVRPKSIGNENIGLREFRNTRGRNRNCGLTARERHSGPPGITWQKIDKFARHRLPR